MNPMAGGNGVINGNISFLFWICVAGLVHLLVVVAVDSGKFYRAARPDLAPAILHGPSFGPIRESLDFLMGHGLLFFAKQRVGHRGNVEGGAKLDPIQAGAIAMTEFEQGYNG
jgi:hypothetical protein